MDQAAKQKRLANASYAKRFPLRKKSEIAKTRRKLIEERERIWIARYNAAEQAIGNSGISDGTVDR